MNTGFSDFQDLINTSITSEAIDDVVDDIKALSNQVDINTNNITTNTNNIATNTNNITLLSGQVLNNTNGIITNANNISFLNSSKVNRLGDYMSGDLNFNNVYRVKGLAEPLISTDASTKNYVDSQIVLAGSSYLRTDGTSFMSGSINFSGSSVSQSTIGVLNITANSSVRLNQGISGLSFDVNNNGIDVFRNSFFYNSIDMKNNVIHNLGIPTHPNDVSRKTELDSEITRATAAEQQIQTNITNETVRATAAEQQIQTNITNEVLRATAVESKLQTEINSTASNVDNNTTLIHQKFDKIGGALYGVLNMNGNYIINVGLINGQNIAHKLDLSGGTMTGNLNMGGHNITNVNLINNLDLKMMDDQILANLNHIAAHTIQFSLLNGRVADNEDDIIDLQNTRLLKSGDTMTGNLNMSNNDVVSCDDVKLNTITPNSTSITAKTTTFIIDAENAGDCKLILRADQSNSDENKNPMIIFQQDGILQESAIFMTSNELNISNSVSTGSGIKFRVDAFDNAWETAQERMSITPAGAIRLGISETTNTISGGLSIFGCATDSSTYFSGVGNDQSYHQIYLRWPGSNTSTGSGAHGWLIGNQTQTPSASDCDLYFNVQRAGVITQPAYIGDVKKFDIAMNFTGQHRCSPLFNFTTGMVGLIVEATGRYMNLLEMGGDCSQMCCITPNDAVPIVDLCTTAKSKRVFGVISDKEDENKRTFGGNFVSNYKKEKGDTRIFINSLGEGSIWVSNLNGNIDNGDYITSSDLPGYGMKQDETTLNNFTVAKATMSCEFNPQLEQVKIYKGYDDEKQQIIWEYKNEYEPEYRCETLGNGVKIALIGCTYHCG